MSFPNERTYSFDANNVLSDNAAAYTASGYLQAGGADGIVDFGGNQGVTITLPSIDDVSSITPQQPRIDAVLIVDVTAIDIASGNETYQLDLMVSNDPAFAAGNVVCAGGVQMGKGTSLRGAVAQKDSVTGRYELMFSNNIAGAIYQYAKAYLTAGGTTPSVSITSYISVLPEP
ncbi:hypothetical protein IVB43_23845 [Bradyrhizobium sp. 48]|uniref:hypothetical protein n=1 Tax=Bradyrhizobium sp. 48 TaxID=2782676 RepID=UPI001FF74FB9|nr:hypothetical protein [Bradyrhizobium sp. 48]MCK1445422.1 hypothetical protein [Bradyrhizobium sp. 48]